MMTGSFESRVQQAVKKIPLGKVASYGQIAAMCGSPKGARTVGWIMRNNSEALPWHRVIASDGRISIANINIPASQQAAMLEQEGVVIFEKKGHLWINKEDFWDGSETKIDDR